MNLPPYIFAIIAVACSVSANFFSKLASSQLNEWKDFFSLNILASIFFYALGTLSYLLLLRKVPLSTAYPLFSVTFVLVILVSHFYFNEVISFTKLFGILLILIGISFVAISTQKIG